MPPPCALQDLRIWGLGRALCTLRPGSPGLLDSSHPLLWWIQRGFFSPKKISCGVFPLSPATVSSAQRRTGGGRHVSFPWGLSSPLPGCPSLSVWQATWAASRDAIKEAALIRAPGMWQALGRNLASNGLPVANRRPCSPAPSSRPRLSHLLWQAPRG